MNDRDFWIGAISFSLGLVLVLGGFSYCGYKYGRMAERRALYQALSQSVADTYYEGFGDGYTAGKKAVKCQEDDEDGRY